MLPLLPLCAVVVLLTVAFMWLARQSHSHTAEKQASAADVAAKNVDKLRGFHGLAKVLSSVFETVVIGTEQGFAL